MTGSLVHTNLAWQLGECHSQVVTSIAVDLQPAADPLAITGCHRSRHLQHRSLGTRPDTYGYLTVTADICEVSHSPQARHVPVGSHRTAGTETRSSVGSRAQSVATIWSAGSAAYRTGT